MAAIGNTLPGRYYAATEIFQQELERIFYQQWLCAGREEQIPEPGDYLVRTVGAESLILVRGRDGAARAFYNVCRHRGTRICTNPSGHFRETIQCRYHAWTYGLDGQLLGAPLMNENHDFRKQNYPLYSVPLESWEGFLFVNLAPEPEPFAAAFAPLIGKFRAWHIPKLREAHRIQYDLTANWKLLFENYSECYHCPLIHPDLVRLSPYRSGRNDLVEGPFLGGSMDINEGLDSMSMSGGRCAPPLGEVSGIDLQRVYYYSIFPNMLLTLHPDYVMYHLMQPQGANRTLVECVWLFDPEAMAHPHFDPGSAVEFWDLTNRQDWEMCELTQSGVGSRAYTAGPYSPMESLLAAFDREVLRVLGHAPV